MPAAARVAAFYPGDSGPPEGAAMRRCDPAGPLMVNVTKLLVAPEGGNTFLALGRVWSGTVRLACAFACWGRGTLRRTPRTCRLRKCGA